MNVSARVVERVIYHPTQNSDAVIPGKAVLAAFCWIMSQLTVAHAQPSNSSNSTGSNSTEPMAPEIVGGIVGAGLFIFCLLVIGVSVYQFGAPCSSQDRQSDETTALKSDPALGETPSTDSHFNKAATTPSDSQGDSSSGEEIHLNDNASAS